MGLFHQNLPNMDLCHMDHIIWVILHGPYYIGKDSPILQGIRLCHLKSVIEEFIKQLDSIV